MDTITTGIGRDIILGGADADTIIANSGESAGTRDDWYNIVLGDAGYIDYVVEDATPADIDRIFSVDVAIGGIDTITTGQGDDIVLGGADGDTISVGDGDNLVFGDSGQITAALGNLVSAQIGSQPITLGLIETIASGTGGMDTITTGIGRDIILGGADADTIIANSGESAGTRDDWYNIVLGDAGYIDYVLEDDAPADLDRIFSVDVAIGGTDKITTGQGDDIVLGGADGDTISVGDGDNLVFGDSGQITAALGNLVSAQIGSQPITLGLIETIASGTGGMDTITTGVGRDIILGGADADTIIANSGEIAGTRDDLNNIVLGDAGYIDYVVEDDAPADLDRIFSVDVAIGGTDKITTGQGDDIVLGGADGDTISVGDGDNLVFGDSGQITAALGNLVSAQIGSQPITLGLIETIASGTGGMDTITTGIGRDIILGGADADTIIANSGESAGTRDDWYNIVLGDAGYIDYVVEDATPADIDRIFSVDVAIGGIDTITTGQGDDIVLGGADGDTISVGDGDNLVFGDSGQITAAPDNPVSARMMAPAVGLFNVQLMAATEVLGNTQMSDQPITFGLVETIASEIGGFDTITAGNGQNVILGGFQGDEIQAGDGRNIVFGDSGYINWSEDDNDAGDIDRIVSTDTEDGGADKITTGSESDIIFGGMAGDTIDAGQGDNNIVFGDNGQIFSARTRGASDLVMPLDGHSITLGRIETIAPADGGDDTIITGTGRDIVLGGYGDDNIFAYGAVVNTNNVRVPADTAKGSDGNNLIIGDNGYIDYVVSDKQAGDIDKVGSLLSGDGGMDIIYTGDANDIVIGGEKGDRITDGAGLAILIADSGLIESAVADTPIVFSAHPLVIGCIKTIVSVEDGKDTIVSGKDSAVIFGGSDDDVIFAGDGDDLVFGEYGQVCTAGLTDLDCLPFSFGNDDLIYGAFEYLAINTQTTYVTGDDNIYVTGDDKIFGEGGDDILLGQQGTDIIYGNAGDDNIIGGHNVAGGDDSVDYLDGGTGDDVIAGDNAEICFAAEPGDPRMRALAGTQIYGVTPPSTGNAGNDGMALVTDTWQSNPDGTIQRHVVLLDHADGTSELKYGSDYIAGGADDDLIFGQLGDDVIQGDGTLDNLVLTTDQNNLPQRLPSVLIGALRDSDNELRVLSSFEAVTDGDDYIEGNGGNDVIFGNLGQDDIIGGSSNLFGLAGDETLASRWKRPDFRRRGR